MLNTTLAVLNVVKLFTFQTPNLAHQVGGLVCRDTGRNYRPRHSCRSSQSYLARDIHVRHVFVFAEEWEVEKNSEGGSVGGEDKDFGGAAV